VIAAGSLDSSITEMRKMSEEKPKPITGMALLEALRDAGIINQGDRIRRVVIDASVNNAVIMYVERIGDSRLLRIASGLGGIEIREVTPAKPEETVPAGGVDGHRAAELLDAAARGSD
jgi:hypothetical protein